MWRFCCNRISGLAWPQFLGPQNFWSTVGGTYVQQFHDHWYQRDLVIFLDLCGNLWNLLLWIFDRHIHYFQVNYDTQNISSFLWFTIFKPSILRVLFVAEFVAIFIRWIHLNRWSDWLECIVKGATWVNFNYAWRQTTWNNRCDMLSITSCLNIT